MSIQNTCLVYVIVMLYYGNKSSPKFVHCCVSPCIRLDGKVRVAI